jgi:hypothetical protein
MRTLPGCFHISPNFAPHFNTKIIPDFMTKHFLTLFVSLLPVLGFAQLIYVQGTVIDVDTRQPIAGATVATDLVVSQTDEAGVFELELSMDVETISLRISAPNYVGIEQSVSIESLQVQDLGTITLSATSKANELLAKEDQIPTVIIDGDDIGDGANTQDISGILTASRDVFVSATAFTFGPARFRLRGLDGENTTILMNGIPMNDLENGRVYWSAWGGLNDVMRNRETDIGLGAIDYTMGGIGGASAIDTRASNQWKQIRASYSISNRTYRNRAMLTWNTGELANGWAFSFSGSRRWGDEGFIEGTFYDAYAYFASIDKKLGKKHLLNLTAFGAPIKRGRSSGVIQELYDLAGTNYYNPNWGFQNGEKRNARVFNTHQPMFILRHDWNITEKATLTTAASYQFGRNGSTAIDWYDARDPRPNYYRYLPSFIEDPALAQQVTQAYQDNPERLQLDWDYMYDVNLNSFETIENANGTGESVSGRRSKYIVEDRRFDSREINVNTIYRHELTDYLTLNGGLGYQYYQGDYHKVVDDLLGGEFYVDINRFAEFDFPAGSDALQNDLDNPNRILREGDRFGYDYDPNIRKGYGWAQGVFSFRRIDFFLSGELSQSTFWREGDVRVGLFPDNSFGQSEKQRFLNYMAKGGMTVKLSNRHYLFANGAMGTRAPFVRNAYLSPRTRDQLVDNLVSERIQSAEAGYLLRSPQVKARASVYFARFQDRTETMMFFNDEQVQALDSDEEISFGFVNFALTGIDQRHIGTELAIDLKLTSALSVNAVAAIGQYIYTSRPTATITNDNNPEIAVRDRVIYQENFFVPGTPQTAYTAGLSYRGKKFWFANLNVNYFDNVYIDFNPNRRTESAVFDIDPNTETDAWESILFQEKADPAMTVDFFGGKSFKFDDVIGGQDMFLYLNIGVSNILNNQNFITGGYEQLRFDFENQDPNRFPARYFYYFGRTYFINLSLRI